MTDVFGATPEDLQKKVYFLLEQLQSMARELPPKYQQRIPCELLSGLANCLLNDTVFEIVKGLMEIQHVTEKHLFQQRLQIINRQKMEVQDVFHHTTEEEVRKKQHALLQLKHTEELKQTDMKLVLQLDQKVSDQQVVLEKAGVPGFYVTNNPLEVQVQMHLLDFILRLSKMRIERVGGLMDSCMLPGERAPVKRSKSWRREHLETYSRHSRYIKVQTLREAEPNEAHSSSHTQMDYYGLRDSENVACSCTSGNTDSVSICRNREALENKSEGRSINKYAKKINETQYENDIKFANFHDQEQKPCAKFTILKRNACGVDVLENIRMDTNVPEVLPYHLNENLGVEIQNGASPKHDIHHSTLQNSSLNDHTSYLSTTAKEKNMCSPESENFHPVLVSDPSYQELTVNNESNESELSVVRCEDECKSDSNNNVEFLFVDLKCSLSGKGILEPRLETKVHSGSLELNDKHNRNYRISSNCANSNNCNCIHQYLLSNGLIGYLITSDFHFQVMTILHCNTSQQNMKVNIDDQDDEEIILNFCQVKQKLTIKSKLRDINNNVMYRRPDERHFTALDSSLKRNTAFVRRLRLFTGSQLPKLLEDMATLNLTKYLSEIASAIVECKLKMSDVWAAVQICCAFHQLYADFATHLLENWHKVLTIKKDDPIPNAAKLRVDLRFYAELITVGIFTPQEGLPILGNALTMLTYWDKDHYNVKIILSFCRHCGLEYAHLISQKVRLLSEKYNISVPTSNFLSNTKMHSVKSLIKDYYESLNKHLVKDYLTMRDFIKQNTRILQTKGELSVKRKEKLECLQTSLKRLLDGAMQLADILDEEAPQLPPDTMSENDRVSVCETNDYEINEGETFWEDEDTRMFYECLPNMKDFVPVKNNSVVGEETQDVSYQQDDSLEDIGEDADSEIDNLDINVEIEMEEQEEEENEEEEIEEEETETKNTSNKMLMEIFLKTLPNCISKELIDKVAIEFVKKLDTKPNRKKLIKSLFTVPRTRPDLLPFYARFVAAVHPVIPDVATELGKMLKQEFRYHIRKKDQLNIESKIKVVRFIAELVKFSMYGRNDALQCLRILVQDFSHHHIDMCCSLVEGCGKFLSRFDDSRFRLHHYLDQIMRKKTVIPLNSRYVTMIENAYYQVNPPEIEHKIHEDRPPEHEFLRNLVYHEMTRSNVDDVLNMILKINWDDPITASYAVKCLTRAYKVKYFNISCLASLTSGIALQQEMEGIQVVDGVLEDIQLGMELNLQEHCQRRVAMIKYLGELYNYRMVENTNIFKALYSLITFGVTWNNELYSPIDPPESLFRIRLVCTLLNTCGEYFSTGSSKRKLDEYLTFFQYYFWFKFSQPCWKSDYPFPYDVQYMYEDIVKRLRPKVRLFLSLEAAQNAAKKICMEYEKLNFPTSDSETSSVTYSEDFDKKIIYDTYEDDSDKHLEEAMISNETATTFSPTKKQPFETINSGTVNVSLDSQSNNHGSSDDHLHDYWSMLRPKSPEDQEFLSAYDRMITENIHNRLSEPVKPQRLDISVPLFIGSISKKSHEKLKTEENPDAVVNFVLILRKGHKALYKNIAVPVNSEMAAIRRYNEEAERAEKEYVKRLTLDINERLEEEDYQEMLTKLQKSTPGNQNRDRRHRSHNSKEVPNVDTIFSPNKKLR